MPALPGSIWVEGEFLCYCPTATEVYRYQGNFVASVPSATPGSIWMTSDGYLNYISQTNIHRVIPFTVNATGVGDSNSIGSLWVEGISLKGITPSNQKVQYHLDQGHQDHTDAPTHSDSHTDTPHSDHSDGIYPHIDYTNPHSDVLHGDSHGDVLNPHYDIYYDNTATQHSDHCDMPIHNDVQLINHTDGCTVHSDYNDIISHQDHCDMPIYNDHTDSHNDHADECLMHFDVTYVGDPGGWHYDNYIHIDGSAYHEDYCDTYLDHSDHSDNPYVDHTDGCTTHTDVNYHSDHSDHCDMPIYNDVPHSDHYDGCNIHDDHIDHSDSHSGHTDHIDWYYDALHLDHNDHGDTGPYTHTDVPHSDTHTDVHSDHADVAHNDQPVFVKNV